MSHQEYQQVRSTTAEVNGPVAVVTGGARGIGRAICTTLAQRGHFVVVADIDLPGARSVAASLPAAEAASLDVTDRRAFRALVSDVEARRGRVDVLVNNAGIMPIGPLLSVSDAAVDQAIDINLRGVIHGTTAVLPGMVERGSGHVINISSVAGRLAVPGGAVYSATKFGVIGFSDGVREEFRNQGVRVTTVLPTFTKTDLIAGTNPPRGTSASAPEDVAAAVAAALGSSRPNVFVPAPLRGQLAIARALPPPLSRALSRLLRLDRMFLDYDPDRRAAYSDRIESRD